MIEMGKQYQTRDGRAVRILCVDGPNLLRPVIGCVEGDYSALMWMPDGTFFTNDDSPHHLDLIPVPTKHEGWIPIIKEDDGIHWANGFVQETSEAAATICARSGGDVVIAHVTWES